jgi:transposase-like protein
VVSVEQWAALRREYFVGGNSIKELARSTGLSRNTIRRALRSERPPSYPEILALKDDSYRLRDRDLARPARDD